MWSRINICTILTGCVSVAVLWLSTSIFYGLPKYSPLSVLENDQEYVKPLTINLSVLQHFKEYQNFASSIWCVMRQDGSKRCHLTNVFYLPQFKEHLVFLLNEHSIISGVESAEMLKDINLSTVKNHSKCFLKLIVFRSLENILRQELLVVDFNNLVMKRFKPDNIMHVIHDDLLPLFLTFQELCQGNIDYCLSSYRLIFLDDNDDGPYIEWYRLFSNHNPIALKTQNLGMLIKNSVVGLSQESIWFDYGFKNTQGPMLNSHFNTLLLKKFSIFIKQRLGIIQNNYISKLHEPVVAVLLNRMLNRRILNTNMIEKYITEAYAKVYVNKVHIFQMDLLVNDSKSMISMLQNTNLLVGIHGSAMIFSIFMPEGSKIIEIFPYGIQPEIVSPIKALCHLLNSYYNYSYWVNKNESNSITHPEYPPLHGGIMHLSSLEQDDIIKAKIVPAVKCCHNPLYLFRMFQDTLVDQSFYSLLNEVLNHNTIGLRRADNSETLENTILNKWYFPPPVFNLTCVCSHNTLKLEWSHPLNISSDTRFSVYLNNGISTTTNVTHLNVLGCGFDQLDELECKNQASLSVWVKTLEDSKESLDTYMLCSYNS